MPSFTDDPKLIEELDRQLEYEDLHAPLEAAIMAVRNRLANYPKVAQVPAGDGWRDIESAPRDGTRVLLWGLAHAEAVIGRWWPDEDTGGQRAMWVYDLNGAGHGGSIPTHWMPLPPAPALNTTEET